MSRAGKPQPQPDEVKPGDIRLLSPPEPPTPEERATRVFFRCKSVTVGPYSALWPGESIGAAMAERWLYEVQQWAYRMATENRDEREIEVVRG
jgi:hypothetical protein